jgi:FkbM family methyltransferase
LNTGLWSTSASLVVRDLGLGDNGFVVEEADPSTPGSLRAVSISDIMQQQQWDSIDLLKLDVEGAEKEIFSSNTESWLPKTRVLVIELHDEMKKGASKAVFAALNKYDFSFSPAGENVVFRNLAM